MIWRFRTIAEDLSFYEFGELPALVKQFERARALRQRLPARPVRPQSLSAPAVKAPTRGFCDTLHGQQ